MVQKYKYPDVPVDANQINGLEVSETPPTDNQILVYDLTTNKIVYENVSGIPGILTLNTRVIHVDKNGSDGNTGSDQSPLLTFTAAFTLAKTLIPVPSYTNPVAIVFGPGEWDEQVIVDYHGISLYGYGQHVTRFIRAGNCLTISDNGVDPEPWDMKIVGIGFRSSDVGVFSVIIQGVAGTTLGGDEIQFRDSYIGGTKSIHTNVLNYLNTQNTYITGEQLYEQTAGIWCEDSESNGAITVDYDIGGIKPYDIGNYGIFFIRHLPRGSITLLNAGFIGEDFRPRELGTTSGTICEGDDSRLSDERPPTIHTSTNHDSSVEATANKNSALGYAGLDASSKINPLQLPAIAITETFVVASEVAMLALVAQTGDVAIRTDLPDTFILAGTDPTVLVDWEILQHPASPVTSVFGRVGVVTAQSGDYLASQITNAFDLLTNKFTDGLSATLVQLNGQVSDATLIDTGDARLSDARTPTAHKDSHKFGGGDAFISTDLIEAIIKRIRTTTGPTDLLVGAIADGEYLLRSGTGIIGGTPAGGTDEKVKSDATDPTAGFLDAKVDGVTLEVDASTHKLRLKEVWESMPITPKMMNPDTDTYNGVSCGSVVQGIYGNRWYLCAFENDTAPYSGQAAHVTLTLPSNYKAGSDLKLVFKYVPNVAVSGDLKMNVGACKLSDGDLLTDSLVYTNAVVTNPGTSLERDSMEIPIAGTTYNPGDNLNLVIYREPGDAADTMSADAWMIDSCLLYRSNLRGGAV